MFFLVEKEETKKMFERGWVWEKTKCYKTAVGCFENVGRVREGSGPLRSVDHEAIVVKEYEEMGHTNNPFCCSVSLFFVFL